ncbi:hypothetical protein [Cyclobacterium xiamenense]|uniref:hypothetical protein n=1 Tax=Cyclobacterium xiamenense TaxID=1297121 RepID=UPI0012B6F73B|nr:hypothetical protein [Cyclobacterium xiamenense]
MKNVVGIFFWCGMVAFEAGAQSHFFKNADVETIVENHETIATLPFQARVTLRPDQMESLSADELASLERLEGQSIQQALFTWFQNHKETGKLAVNVQDPAVTNSKLTAAGISLENYQDIAPSQLAAILGVDAIVTGSYETNQPLGANGEENEGILAPEANLAVINLFIYNAADGELLLQFHNGIYGSKESLNNGLVEALLKKVSRKMVYAKT